MFDDDAPEFWIHAKCHPTSPLRVYMSRAGELVITCFTCDRRVLVPGSLPAPQRALARVVGLVGLGVLLAVIVAVATFYRAA